MKIKFGILSLIAGIILASCSTGNDVVSGRGIQKRKYNDGYYISWNKNNGKSESNTKVNEPSILSNNQEPTNEIIAPEHSLDLITEKEFDAPEQIQLNVISKPAKTDLNKNLVPFKKSPIKTSNKLAHKLDSIKTYSPSENQNDNIADVNIILLVILAFLLPWLAVGIYTNWDVLYTVLAVLLWFLAIIPGIVFALLVIFGIV